MPDSAFISLIFDESWSEVNEIGTSVSQEGNTRAGEEATNLLESNPFWQVTASTPKGAAKPAAKTAAQ